MAAQHAGQGVDLSGVGVGAGRGEQTGRHSPRAGGQSLGEQALHRGQLVGGDRAVVHPRRHQPQRVVTDLQDDVEGRRGERGDVVGEAGLAERQPRRAGRQVLTQHGGAPGQGGGDGEAAVTDDLQRHALPDLGLRARVQRQGEVGMRVDVDEAGRDHLAARVDDPARGTPGSGRDRPDAAAAHAHVGLTARRPRAVDHEAAADQQVVHERAGGHGRVRGNHSTATTPASESGRNSGSPVMTIPPWSRAATTAKASAYDDPPLPAFDGPRRGRARAR